MINENDIIFDNLAEEVFPYLDDLRESGVTNMFGAHQYVMEDFEINKKLAIKLVSAWVQQFELELKKTTNPEYGDNLIILSLEEKKNGK